MSEFVQAIRKLGLDHREKVNKEIELHDIADKPYIMQDFKEYFLPYITVIVDSREKDDWISKACKHFHINCCIAVKDKKLKTENLKEGDITFKVNYGSKEYDYTGSVVYERKGSCTELYNNIISDRGRFEREFERQKDKRYKKFVLLLEVGNSLFDLIDYNYCYTNRKGIICQKSCGMVLFATIMSWLQPNKYNCTVLQLDTQSFDKKERFMKRKELFFLMLLDMFYFFRQEIRLEAERGGGRYDNQEKL